MDRLLKNNLGISPVVSSIILTSVMLVIVTSASFLANNILIDQVENAEFDLAEDVMLALNNMVKEVMYKPFSSRYIKTGFQTTVPQLVRTGENISVWVQVTGQPREYLIQNSSINIIKIQGGTMVDDLERDIVGTSSVLLNDFTSLGHVYIQRSDRAEIILDFARVRCVYTGTLKAATQCYNVIEITFVNMTIGLEHVHNKAVFIVRNLGLEKTQYLYEGNLTIGADDTYGNSESILYTNLPYNSTLINLVVVNVEISLVGGG